MMDWRPAAQPQADADAAQPPTRGVALAEVALCCGLPTQLTVASALSIFGITAAGAAGAPLSLTYVVALSLGDTLLLTALIAYLLRRHGENPATTFLGGRPALPEVRLGLALIPLIVLSAAAALVALHAVWPALRNVPENPLEALLRSPVDALLLLVVAVVAGGLREELQRAFILRRFEQRLGGGWLGLVLFSAAFGIGHYIQGWDAAVVTAALGALWGALYLLRRSVVAAVVSHAGFNAVEILIALAAAR